MRQACPHRGQLRRLLNEASVAAGREGSTLATAHRPRRPNRRATPPFRSALRSALPPRCACRPRRTGGTAPRPHRPRVSPRGHDAGLPGHRRDHRGDSQSHAVGPHGRDRAHHHRQRRGDGPRHRPREAAGEEPADSRAGRDHVDHVQGGAERHLLLHAAGPPALGHGGPAGRLRRAADDLGRRRRPGRGSAPAQSRLRGRLALGLDGDGRRVHDRQGGGPFS